MKLQNYEKKDQDIKKAFLEKKKKNPQEFKRKIDLSFCTLMFGLEPVVNSIERLAGYGYKYIEILGNCAGETVGNHRRNRHELFRCMHELSTRIFS